MPERAHPRYEVEAYVDVTAASVLLYHHIRNLSLGGVCIATPLVEPVGTRVDVVINFPDLGTQMAVQGEIVWVSPVTPAEVGIHWVDLDDERRALLERFISLVKTRELVPDRSQQKR